MSSVPNIEKIAKEPWLSFQLNGQHYAVLLSQVSEVIRDAVPTPVPGAAEDLLGVCHLRGNIVPVMDGRKRLGFGAADAGDSASVRIVVFAHEAHRVGLRVDAVGDLLQPKVEAIEPPPARSGRVDDPVQAVMGWEGGFVALLDVVRLCRLQQGLKDVA
ncbi:chemotaxis protein CheW [Dyella caseinilytica]|uniref:Purine-binding chemotaxis protein CheW n=1 Tax=Dyella caseinilytica TaxID=1849581 RepID=A0ABX7GSV1_9GAMM|nr:chemotaxis protein CheW [Dyella caseinilytica]QRN53384.1 purine-binding chemotaxis protein CheW [Dyella caseinilytica]GFZ86086.1 chemotaxis protein CheW [Dyella caseinilytica]